MYNCCLLLGSRTVGSALAVAVGPVRMMGHLTMKLLMVHAKFPEACDISLLLRTARSSIWRECGVGGEERSYCRTCPVSLLGFAAPPELWTYCICSWTYWCLVWASWTCSSALDCIHMWQAPSDWGFCSITWHRAVSHRVLLAKKLCTVHVCDFDDNALLLTSGFASLLDKYYCRYIFKTWGVRPALQGPSPAPFL